MSALEDPGTELTPTERRGLRRLAGFMLPASAEYDGSIWVTAGGVNPTSTIQAVALYIADTIKKRLARLFD